MTLKGLLALAASVAVLCAGAVLMPSARSSRSDRGAPAPIEQELPAPLRLPRETTGGSDSGREAPAQPDRGSVVIVGRVRVAGSPAPARVTCVPHGYEGDVRRAVADAGGFFRFDDLPDAFGYRLAGATPSHYGEIEVDRAAATSGAVAIDLATLFYERYRFVDPDGVAVEIGQEAAALLCGSVIDSTHTASLPTSTGALLASLGVVMPRETGVFASAYSGAGVGPLADPVLVHVPGYAPVAVERHRRALSEWPAETTVRLRRGKDTPRLVRYRVEFPEIPWPGSWGDPDEVLDLSLRIRREDTSRSLSLHRRMRSFALAEGVGFEVVEPTLGELPYSRRPSADGSILVLPAYPAYGYVEVRVPAVRDATHAYAILLADLDGAGAEVGGAGHGASRSRIGPVPVGRYEVRLYKLLIASPTGPRERVQTYGEIDVREGLNVFERP